MKNKIIIIILILSVIHFAISAYFGIVILGGVPHIPDSTMYYRQGILFSQGKLLISNFTREPPDAYKLLGITIENGRFYFQYNSFWGLLLALPIKLHFVQLFNPFLSAVSLILVYLIATRLYNKKIGCGAALLYCVSPLIIILAGDYMGHTATQLFLLAGIYSGLLYIDNPRPWPAVCAGIFLGYAFNLRQLTAVAVAFPVVVYAFIFYRKQIFRFKGIFFIVGLLPILGLFLLENQLFTGSIAEVHHVVNANNVFAIRNLPLGIDYQDATFAFLPTIIFYNFLPVLFFAFACIPLIIYHKKEDFLLISIFLSLLVFYMFTNVVGNHGYGPRYLFEACFALFILASRGAIWVYNQLRDAYKIVLVIFFAVALIYNSMGLYTILPMYKNYNGLYPDVISELQKIDFANSIVVLGQSYNWQTDGITATLYDPSYEKSFFIKELPNKEHEKVFMHYPNKTIYKLVDKTIYKLVDRQSSLYELDNSINT